MPALLCKLLPFFCQELKDAQVEFTQSQMHHGEKRSRGQDRTTSLLSETLQEAIRSQYLHIYIGGISGFFIFIYFFVYDLQQCLCKHLRWILWEPESYWDALKNPDFLHLTGSCNDLIISERTFNKKNLPNLVIKEKLTFYIYPFL